MNKQNCQVNLEPWISIVVATYNSERFVKKMYTNLKYQVPPDNSKEMEIIFVDGGSSDSTIEIAKKLGIKVLPNEKGDPIHAKHIGFLAAKSRFICFLDHDEILISRFSLLKRTNFLGENKSIGVALTSGYKIRKFSHSSNFYASEFGDPLSLFLYRTSGLEKYRLKSLTKKLNIGYSNEDCVVLESKPRLKPVLLELVAMGTVINKDFFLNNFAILKSKPSLLPHLYYLLQRSTPAAQIAYFLEDNVLHETAENWSKVFLKISWRVQNNLVGKAHTNQAGIRGRSALDDFRLLRYFHICLFFPYVMFFFPIVIDSCILAYKRKCIAYLMNIPLGYWVVVLVFKFLYMKVFKIRFVTRRYDGSWT